MNEKAVGESDIYEFLELFSAVRMYVGFKNTAKNILGIINVEKENELFG